MRIKTASSENKNSKFNEKHFFIMMYLGLKCKNIFETKFHNKNLDLLILSPYSKRYVKVHLKIKEIVRFCDTFFI